MKLINKNSISTHKLRRLANQFVWGDDFDLRISNWFYVYEKKLSWTEIFRVLCSGSILDSVT